MGTVLRKNRKINYCLAAVEDMDHLAGAFRKYPKNSNITSKDLKEASYSVSYSSRWHITACHVVQRVRLLSQIGDRLEYIWGYFTKLTVRHLSGPGVPGAWNLCSTPHILKIILKTKRWFEGEKNLILRAVSLRPTSVTAIRFKAIADNFSGLSRIWSFAKKVRVQMILRRQSVPITTS